MMVPLLVFRVRSFSEPFDHGQPPVPLRGELRHGPDGLVETVGFHLGRELPGLVCVG